MVFSYDERAGDDVLRVDGENFRHLFLSRRAVNGDKFIFRNLHDSCAYEYEAQNIGKKEAILKLLRTQQDPETKKRRQEIAWCVVDPKTIEKTLPMLNEIGVDSIYFVYADRSQKNFKLDIERINRILVNSCCQCGRTSLMDISVFKNIKEFCASNKQFLVLDFGGEKPTLDLDMDNALLIGPEGGFSESERELLKKTAKKIIAFGTQNILRSETAVVAAASLCII